MIARGQVAVSILLDWRDLLNIASVLLAIYSVRKMLTAQQAEKLARRKLLIQRAAEDFYEMTRSAANLMASVRSKEWIRSAEIATVLRSGLAGATGSWPHLLNSPEKDNLAVASKGVNAVIETISIIQPADELEKVQAMVAQCIFTIEVLGEIAGRLKYPDESGANNE
jgi:hypothetical protein